MNKNRILSLANKISKKSSLQNSTSTVAYKLFKNDDLYKKVMSTLDPTELIYVCMLVPVPEDERERTLETIMSRLFIFTYYTVDDDNLTEDCPDCSGDGEIDCGECNGAGSLDCNTCDGNGDVDCDTCDGTGEDEEGDECGYCDGSGRENCGDCRGSGNDDCSWCGGSGRETCSYCEGRGDVDKEDYYGITQYFVASWDDKLLNKLELLDVDDVMDDSLTDDITYNKKSLIYDTNGDEIFSLDTLNVDDEHFFGFSTNPEFRKDSGHIVDTELNYKD